MEFKFGSVGIVELGDIISEKLAEDGITEKAELIVYVNNDEFKKIDEDLFYRTRKDESIEFVPSEGEIEVNFEGVNIIIKQK
jgi:hypothetical protein